MPALTRRRDPTCPDSWMIYFGDIRVGDIGPRAGVPTNPDQWGWYDIEPQFVCKACGKRGADVRPNYVSKMGLRPRT